MFFSVKSSKYKLYSLSNIISIFSNNEIGLFTIMLKECYFNWFQHKYEYDTQMDCYLKDIESLNVCISTGNNKLSAERF